jgi:hypothetical protein
MDHDSRVDTVEKCLKGFLQPVGPRARFVDLAPLLHSTVLPQGGW